MSLKFPDFLKKLSPVNLIVTPIKQHLGCCVVAPLVLKLLGASLLAEMIIRNPWWEFFFLALLLPPVVWGILKLEDKWRARHERKHAAHHEHCADHCHIEPSDFKKRYILNLIIAFGIALILHLAFHHHNAGLQQSAAYVQPTDSSDLVAPVMQ